MKYTKFLAPLALVAGLPLALGATGCNRFGDFCAAAADCEHGNDLDIEACQIQAEAAEDEASLYGCSEWFDEWQECYESRARCENGDYGLAVDDCGNEHERYSSCMSE